jgi:predicted phage-related endonuclease
VNALLSTLGLTSEQKALRRDALGGSDANTIMGGDEKKLLRLWREKRGEAEPEDLSDILAVQMGSFTEPFNAAWFEKNTGYRVIGSGKLVKHATIAHMRATLDGEVVENFGTDDETELGVFEAKHCGTRSTDAEIFARYVPQLTHNCLCAGFERAFLSVFKGNGDWVMFEYELDDAYAERLIAAEAVFWDCVRTGKPPCSVEPEPTPKPVGVVEYSMQGNNEWASHCADYIETELAADRHELARKSLKALMPDDASKCFGYGLELRRDKRGAVRFYKESAE